MYMRTIQKFIRLSIWLFVSAQGLMAQTAPPVTDLYWVEMDQAGGQVQLGIPENLTKRHGYDNQPMFLPDGTSILYASMREDGQTDIRQMNLETRESYFWCETEESEYSPTLMPSGQRISVVRVEMDSTQRVWSFTLDGKEPQVEYPEVKGVGYHCWGEFDRMFATFIVGEPVKFHVFENDEPEPSFELEEIGRSIHPIPNRHAVSFVDKGIDQAEDGWMIREVDLATKEVKDIITTLEGKEDYCWGPDGTIWMPSGKAIYKFHPDQDNYWVKIADFPELTDINGFYRIAVNQAGTGMILVSTGLAKQKSESTDNTEDH